MNNRFTDGKPPYNELADKWKSHYVVYTDNPINETWNTLQHFTNYEYLCEFLSRGRGPQIEIIRIKDQRFVRKLASEETIYKKIPLLQNLVKQSYDFYKASTALPLLSKPILLLYSYETLAEFFYQSIGKVGKKNKYSHGLYYDAHKHIIEIKREGLFQSFHSSYSPDLLESQSFTLSNLVNCGSINSFELETYSSKIYNNKIKNLDGKDVCLSELDREFLFIYSLSILARYNIMEWSSILDGIRSEVLDPNIGILIRRYLNAIELIFPLLVLNELRRESCIFFQPARLMPDNLENYNDKII